MGKRGPAVEEMPFHFWNKVLVGDDCWEWQGARLSGGRRMPYGVFTWEFDGKRRPWMAHRVAWELWNGQPIPTGMFVLHTCDNPPCVRPDHLRLGTLADNYADMIAKNRQGFHCSGCRCEELKAACG